MSTTIQKIQEIEAEMARTQKNKATSNHLGKALRGSGGGGVGEG